MAHLSICGMHHPLWYPPPACYTFAMRTVTFALDDDTYLRFEKTAERRNTSVAELAKTALIEASSPPSSPVTPEEFERLRQLEIEVRKGIKYFSASENIPREDLYDRKRR
jgi:hypothetical protein